MSYVGVQYISMARNTEGQHHEHIMKQLRAKIAQLTKAVTWELKQHDSRLKELQQAEDALTMSHTPTASGSTQPTVTPIHSARHQSTQSEKFVPYFEQKPVFQLVR